MTAMHPFFALALQHEVATGGGVLPVVRGLCLLLDRRALVAGTQPPAGPDPVSDIDETGGPLPVGWAVPVPHTVVIPVTRGPGVWHLDVPRTVVQVARAERLPLRDDLPASWAGLGDVAQMLGEALGVGGGLASPGVATVGDLRRWARRVVETYRGVPS